MFIVVGLGNPGKKYQKTRHNLGFLALDALRKESDFPDFHISKKFNALISEGEIAGRKTLLVKPQTFMNNSGTAVKKIIGNWKPFGKLRPSAPSGLSPRDECLRLRLEEVVSRAEPLEIGNLLVVHDDIDLPLGELKISQNRGSAGHKGVESIIKALKTKGFVRFRIGAKPAVGPMDAENFVLGNFTKTEEKIIKKTLNNVVWTIKAVVTEGVEKAMNEHN